MTLRSGDRVVLDETVSEIKSFVSRKGAEMRGPHPKPPRKCRVTLPKRLTGNGGSFREWTYTIYTREIEIVGHDAVARSVASRSFPSSLQVVVQIEQLGRAGDF